MAVQGEEGDRAVPLRGQGLGPADVAQGEGSPRNVACCVLDEGGQYVDSGEAGARVPARQMVQEGAVGASDVQDGGARAVQDLAQVVRDEGEVGPLVFGGRAFQVPQVQGPGSGARGRQRGVQGWQRGGGGHRVQGTVHAAPSCGVPGVRGVAG